jgi:mannose-6-phosphate isomerase-like protein (cupin superfamily)
MGGRLAALLQPVNLPSIHVYVLAANTPVELHYHDFDEYWLFFQGNPTVTIRTPAGRKEEFELGPGDLVVAPASVEHTLRADHDLHYFQFSSHPPEGARLGHLIRESA